MWDIAASGRQEQTVRIGAMRYVIFVPAGDTTEAALAECLAYAEREYPAWQSLGVIIGRWAAVAAMLEQAMVDVILVADRSQLPPDRLPRVVAVQEQAWGRPSGSPRPTRRRPHPLV